MLNLLSLKLEIQEFTTKEFISMIEKKKKQNNLGNEIIKSNIILYGIENYYNLISKWMKKRIEIAEKNFRNYLNEGK